MPYRRMYPKVERLPSRSELENMPLDQLREFYSRTEETMATLKDNKAYVEKLHERRMARFKREESRLDARLWLIDSVISGKEYGDGVRESEPSALLSGC